jgi:hypothetical protein
MPPISGARFSHALTGGSKTLTLQALPQLSYKAMKNFEAFLEMQVQMLMQMQKKTFLSFVEVRGKVFEPPARENLGLSQVVGGINVRYGKVSLVILK